MRFSATKTIAILGIAAAAALGTQYASAAPSGSAQPAVPQPNVDYQYSTSGTGGTGDAVFNIPNPPNGLYSASFTANFFPAGSVSAPEQFSCSLIKDGSIMRAQSTLTSVSDSGFYAGVNGGNVIKIDGVAQFAMYGGTADGSTWSWGTRPVQVNLLRIDGLQQGSLTGGSPKVHKDLSLVGGS
jgi:hypothetical protein